MLAIHQCGDVVGVGGVAAVDAVPAHRPQISGFHERSLFEGGSQVEVVVFHLALIKGTDELLNLGVIKPGQLRVEISSIKVSDEQGEFGFIPIARDFIERNVEGFFSGFVEFDDDAVDLGVSEGGQYFESLMAADDMSGGLVPDDGFDVAKLAQGAFELFELRVTRLEVFTRVIRGGLEITDRQAFDVHASPPPFVARDQNARFVPNVASPDPCAHRPQDPDTGLCAGRGCR